MAKLTLRERIICAVKAFDRWTPLEQIAPIIYWDRPLDKGIELLNKHASDLCGRRTGIYKDQYDSAEIGVETRRGVKGLYPL